MSIRCCTISYVESIYNPDEFARWLTEAFSRSTYKSWQEVADEIGSSRSTLSRYAGAKPQYLTGKPSQPSPELTVKLAKLFGDDVNKVLTIAGHATQGDMFPSLIAAIGFDGLIDEDIEEIAKFIRYKKAQRHMAEHPEIKLLDLETLERGGFFDTRKTEQDPDNKKTSSDDEVKK